VGFKDVIVLMAVGLSGREWGLDMGLEGRPELRFGSILRISIYSADWIGGSFIDLARHMLNIPADCRFW
jgi:hypothetical protein